MPDMTTITMIAQPAAVPSLKAPTFVGIVLVLTACAMMIVVSAVLFLTCLTMRSEMGVFLGENLEQRILISGSPSKSCGSDGVEREIGVPNCFDHRGFRVVVGESLGVYSMRHQKPLFIFGLQKGLTFTNERISTGQLEAERSSFLRYMADVGE
jgi:hypothetical protein